MRHLTAIVMSYTSVKWRHLWNYVSTQRICSRTLWIAGYTGAIVVHCSVYLLTPILSSLKITDRSFRYASPRLWNPLPDSFRQPHHSRLNSPPHPFLNSSLSSSPLSSSITPSLFHSRLKTYLFNKSFPPYRFLLPTGLPHDNGTRPDLSRSLFYF